MYDFENLQETTSNQSSTSIASIPQTKSFSDATAQEKHITGDIGTRDVTNKYYQDVNIEKNFWTLKDKKYRSLWVSVPMTKAAHAGKDGTYYDIWNYQPMIPSVSANKPRDRRGSASNTMNDVMTLLDSEHALNAEKHVKLSHGGIRNILPAGTVNRAVDNVVPTVGPDTTDLDSMRGLQFEYNYGNMDQLKHIARQNFMKAVAGLNTEKDTSARPVTSAV